MSKPEVLPQSDLSAERSILGAIMLDNDLFFDQIGDLSAEDFALESHTRIFRVMTEIMFEMVDGVKSVDIVTLESVLRQRNQVQAIGGVAYLASLTEGLPRRPSIDEYVNIVREKSRLRKLIRIGKDLYLAATDATAVSVDLTERIQAELLEVIAEEGAKAAHVADFVDEIEADVISKRNVAFDRINLGLTWGIDELDKKTKGAFGGELTMVGGESGGGKLIDVEELIPTPYGFVKNGYLRAGDEIFGEDGEVYRVIVAHPIQQEEAFRVSFDDGTFTHVHAGHLWHTWTHKDRASAYKKTQEFRDARKKSRPSRGTGAKPYLAERNARCALERQLTPACGLVKTTAEIMQTIRYEQPKGASWINHSVQISLAAQTEPALLLVDPYILGVWLGDGSINDGGVTIGVEDSAEMIELLTAAGATVTKRKDPISFGMPGLRVKLRELGVLADKHIPKNYLWASPGQRLALLQGLMDTDGTCAGDGQSVFDNTNESLARGVYHLAASLGVKPYWRERRATLYGKDCGPLYKVSWTAKLPCFRLKRKAARLPQKLRSTQKWRYIVSVEPAGQMEMRCITTSNPSGLYLFGRNFNVTHNTQLIMQMILENALAGIPCGVMSMEMEKADVIRRFYPMMAKIITAGHMRDPRAMTLHTHVPDLQAVTRAIKKLPIWVDDTSPLTLRKFLARVKLMIHKYGVQLIVVDYLQLIQFPGKTGVDRVEAVQFGIRDFVKKQKTRHMVVLSQYAKEQAAGFSKRKKRRTKDDLYGGAVVHQAAQNVFLIHIDDPDKSDTDTIDAEIAIEKQREGTRGRVPIAQNKDSLRFVTRPEKTGEQKSDGTDTNKPKPEKRRSAAGHPD